MYFSNKPIKRFENPNKNDMNSKNINDFLFSVLKTDLISPKNERECLSVSSFID